MTEPCPGHVFKPSLLPGGGQDKRPLGAGPPGTGRAAEGRGALKLTQEHLQGGGSNSQAGTLPAMLLGPVGSTRQVSLFLLRELALAPCHRLWVVTTQGDAHPAEGLGVQPSLTCHQENSALGATAATAG